MRHSGAEDQRRELNKCKGRRDALTNALSNVLLKSTPLTIFFKRPIDELINNFGLVISIELLFHVTGTMEKWGMLLLEELQR